MTHTRLIQFAKAPILGKVKTRLAPALSEQQRNELHCAMTTWICNQLSQCTNASLELWVDGEISHPLFQQLQQQTQCELHAQRGIDLGERMLFAFERALAKSKPGIIVGSDCPFITVNTINQVTLYLNEVDCVIVPADDGGYVLLAMNSIEKTLFEDIDWGSDTVLETTIQKLKYCGRSYFLMPSLPDIDRPEDLAQLDNPSLPAKIQAFSR